jgi:membrane protein DedA with SNARE-associated domain
VRPVGGVVTASVGSAGMPGLFGLLLAMEAGVPVPVPGDLVMLLVGERVSAGALPLWVAVAALELVAVAGTATLFLLARGPARTLLARVGPRVGLTEARQARASALLERRGGPALATGRCTPGLRTVTVVAAAASGLSTGRAVPALVLGSSAFLQAHLLLGLALGPVARELLGGLRLPALLALVALLVVAVAWLLRRRQGAGRTLAEGCCPACLAAGALSSARLRTETRTAP